ncbi:MAG: cytochrome C [Candidatus Dadabacteria bacterium]|nr:cytochrome C [Candidatus Dadabacteria bacterium]
MDELKIFLGPRIPRNLWIKNKKRFLLPSVILSVAAFILLVSIFLPYWNLTLHAPQYPDGLNIQLYVNKVVGDVSEVDGLNHYIGMKPLGEAAPLERSLSVYIIAGIVLLCVAAVFVHSPVALFLNIPAMLYPVFFLGDLYFWLHNFGMNLDQRAPLSGAIKPFVPPLLGEGRIGQFGVTAVWDVGLWMSIAASVLILIGLYFHRRAYKSLLDARFVEAGT